MKKSNENINFKMEEVFISATHCVGAWRITPFTQPMVILAICSFIVLWQFIRL